VPRHCSRAALRQGRTAPCRSYRPTRCSKAEKRTRKRKGKGGELTSARAPHLPLLRLSSIIPWGALIVKG